MPHRSGHSLKLFGTQTATLGIVLSMMIVAPDAAHPQASSPPPSLGIQSPAQQPVPAQPEPQQIEPPAAPREENPGLINEIGKLLEKSKTCLLYTSRCV